MKYLSAVEQPNKNSITPEYIWMLLLSSSAQDRLRSASFISMIILYNCFSMRDARHVCFFWRFVGACVCWAIRSISRSVRALVARTRVQTALIHAADTDCIDTRARARARAMNILVRAVCAYRRRYYRRQSNPIAQQIYLLVHGECLYTRDVPGVMDGFPHTN